MQTMYLGMIGFTSSCLSTSSELRWNTTAKHHCIGNSPQASDVTWAASSSTFRARAHLLMQTWPRSWALTSPCSSLSHLMLGGSCLAACTRVEGIRVKVPTESEGRRQCVCWPTLSDSLSRNAYLCRPNTTPVGEESIDDLVQQDSQALESAFSFSLLSLSIPPSLCLRCDVHKLTRIKPTRAHLPPPHANRALTNRDGSQVLLHVFDASSMHVDHQVPAGLPLL